jgi:predicted DNA-binding transcriptional regulator AlpA
MAPLTFLTIDDVLAKTRLPRQTFYDMRRDGRFPQPVRTGRTNVMYPSTVVDEWLRANKPRVLRD